MVSEEQRIKHNEICNKYYYKNKEQRLAYMKEHRKEYIKRSVCRLIRAHVHEFKDDPERLSSEFMVKLCKVKCEV